MKSQNDLFFQAVYHELSQKYGQSMTMKEVCEQLKVQKQETARQRIPRGWVGAGKGLRMETVIFARQFVDLALGGRP